MKKCCTCKEEKPLQEFTKNRSNSDGLSKYCRSCVKNRDKKHYQNDSRKKYLKEAAMVSRDRNRQYLLEYLCDKCCVDCGESDPVVLEFDHQGDKHNDISKMAHNGTSLRTLKQELDKCEIRCANCHRRKTAKDFDWFRQRSSIGRAMVFQARKPTE